MTQSERLHGGLSRALSTALASAAGTFAALVLLSMGIHGTGVGSALLSGLWPGMAAIVALSVAVFLMGVQIFVDVIHAPDQTPESRERWERSRFRSRAIGGFGTPLGLLLVGSGWIGELEHLLWAGAVITLLSLLQLVLSFWITHRIRRWPDADRAALRKPYEPFEQLRELLTAAPARIVTGFLAIGFVGLGVLVVFNLGVLGNQAGYSGTDFTSAPRVSEEDTAIVETMITVIAIAFALALVVAFGDIVRGFFDGGEAHPLERIAHPLAGIAPALIAVGFAFVLVVPGEIPNEATDAHVQEMSQFVLAGVAGVGVLVLACVFAVAGYGARDAAEN
ncbi:MAG: hypothetical protein ACTHYY_01935 [Agrococcus casei]|uniref:hypothetical protein n=1 Tax=Agrococcus casei TaxID=343512 RepID=UPI003F915318